MNIKTTYHELENLYAKGYCNICGTAFDKHNILLQMYDHPEGVYIESKGSPQWIFAECKKCGQEVSIYKLKIERY